MVDSVATTALIVALVAFFTALGQLLQQYFATADGYRRCQPSVMGLWAKKTKLRWRWSEFRFETIFTIPRITYTQRHGHNYNKVVDDVPLTNTVESLQSSMTFPEWDTQIGRNFYFSDDLACWVPLLAQLHQQGGQILEAALLDPCVPAVQFIQKSWDFMPPDIVRPMASSTVSYVGIMARRLGMIWKTFDPGSSMRAEGNGHVITSTFARSLGIILQYTFTARHDNLTSFYNPYKEADMLGFGIVALDPKLFPTRTRLPRIEVGSYEGFASTFPKTLRANKHRDQKQLSRSLLYLRMRVERKDHFIPGINDVVSLCMPMLLTRVCRLDKRWIYRVPSPNLYSRGVTASREGFQVFWRRTEELIYLRPPKTSKQLLNIRELCNKIKNYDDLWDLSYDAEDKRATTRQIELTTMLIECHEDMTVFLAQSEVSCRMLVNAHLLSALNQTVDNSKDTTSPYLLHGPDQDNIDWALFNSMNGYFKSLPVVVKTVIQDVNQLWYINGGEGNISEAEVEDAWLSMMLRAFCWQRCHEMIEGVPPLPSEYWSSKIPVYIG